jgi:hypothetical protein
MGFDIENGSSTCVWFQATVVIPHGQRGCNGADLFLPNSVLVFGTAPVAVPYAGETSYFQEWQSDSYGPGVMLSKAILSGPNFFSDPNHNYGGLDGHYDWSGRVITEAFQNQQLDTSQCWDIYGPGASGYWYMSSDGNGYPSGATGVNWYKDSNGYAWPPYGSATPEFMGELRKRSTLPCGLSWNQAMFIEVPVGACVSGSSWCNYDNHILVNQVSSETNVHMERSINDDNYNAYGWTSGFYKMTQALPTAFTFYSYFH